MATSTSSKTRNAYAGSILQPAHLTFEDEHTRFGRKLGELLQSATRVFYEKGYAAASMRDLSRATGMSLAGLYHYCESKEKLLYLIQKHTFTTIVHDLRERLKGVAEPEERIRIFIRNHLEYFLANKEAMKVLSHEMSTLAGAYALDVAAIKREYYRICVGLLEELKKQRGVELCAPTRIAVLSLFGMINWIYTWHNPRTDADPHALAKQMADIFLKGVCTEAPAKKRREPRSAVTRPREAKEQ